MPLYTPAGSHVVTPLTCSAGIGGQSRDSTRCPIECSPSLLLPPHPQLRVRSPLRPPRLHLLPVIMSIVCVAIIGKDNDPLYIRTWLDHVDIPAPLPGQIAADPSLKFHYHVHTSIDVVEEKGPAPHPAPTLTSPAILPLQDPPLSYPSSPLTSSRMAFRPRSPCACVSDKSQACGWWWRSCH